MKCSYCAFYSEASNGGLVDRYVSALCRELEQVSDRLEPETIFFGGGTPSILNLSQWRRIFSAMNRPGPGAPGEWTVECNPATVSLDKARLLKDHGVNRISMGVQTLQKSLLKKLGRIHSRDQVFRSFDILRQAGFSNINLDLMFGIPGQSMEDLEATIVELTALGSEHLSCYEVIYEEDTPLFHQLQAGEFDIDEELNCRMHERLTGLLEQAGFIQYEVANFARRQPGDDRRIPHFACRHNVNCWLGGDYLGLGPGACGHIQGTRTRNIANTTVYCQRVEQGLSPVDQLEQLPPLMRAGEAAAFGIRMNRGWQFDEFRALTGHDLRAEWREEMDQLVRRRHAQQTEDRFHLTPTGMRFADDAAQLFLR